MLRLALRWICSLFMTRVCIFAIEDNPNCSCMYCYRDRPPRAKLPKARLIST